MGKNKGNSQVIQKLVGNNTITTEGKEWLTLALDPFHDYDHQVSGYPDADTDATVVTNYQFGVDVSRPAGLAADALWDAHIFTLPILRQAAATPEFLNVNGDGRSLSIVGQSTGSLNMVNVYKTASGNPLFPQDIAASANMAGYPVTSPSNTYPYMTQRLIGAGIEIVDTTAVIYKQGALVCYKQAQEPALVSVNHDGSVSDFVSTMYRVKAPPNTVAQALLLTGSRQWDAKMGCYSVLTQSKVENPMQTVGNLGVFVVSPAVINSSGFGTVPSVTTGGQVYENCAIVPFNTSGIILTGLNYNATFRLKIRLYFEVAPSFVESALTPLATPSAPYDPAVLEAYSKVLSSLPVGVMARDNAMGDWWRSILRALSEVALPVSMALTPIFGPNAPLVGSLIKTIATSATGRSVAKGQNVNDATGGKQLNKFKVK